tara:strand:+ start:4591 stop:5001 length:411 start_codon:yes stop_codon:yes gene_type:complete
MVDFVFLNLKIAIFILSLYHTVTAIIAIFFTNFSTKFYEWMYGFHFRGNDQLLLSFKPWGTFALFSGLIGFIFWWDPIKYQLLSYPFIILLLFRVSYRFILRKKIKVHFNTPLKRNYFNIALILYFLLSIIGWLLV